MKFTAKEGQALTTALLVMLIPPVLIAIWNYHFIGFLLFFPVGILLYLYFGTVYLIYKQTALLQAVLTNGFIDIDTIEEVSKRMHGDVDVATVTDGFGGLR